METSACAAILRGGEVQFRRQNGEPVRYYYTESLSTLQQMPPPASASRTRRSDAERNRARILAAARTAFADPEAEVSMAEVSRRAGVGMATLYRNFPSRQQLLETLFTDEVNAVCEAAGTQKAETSRELLHAWLRRFFVFAKSKRHIASELLADNEDTGPVFFNQNRARVLVAGRPLLAAAQHSHEVRDDLTLEQVLEMIIAIAQIHGDSDFVEPILQAALDGLRPQPM
jgi:AcrR family transcriptional regulator